MCRRCYGAEQLADYKMRLLWWKHNPKETQGDEGLENVICVLMFSFIHMSNSGWCRPWRHELEFDAAGVIARQRETTRQTDRQRSCCAHVHTSASCLRDNKCANRNLRLHVVDSAEAVGVSVLQRSL